VLCLADLDYINDLCEPTSPYPTQLSPANMFDENFSFASPRSPSIGSSTVATRESSRSVSPCSTAGPFRPPRLSVTDLAAQFADQRLRKESSICYDSCEAYANNDDDADWSIPSTDDDDEEFNQLSRARTFPQRSQSPSRRTQRQLNTRLLCTASHHRDIATLVARMVNAKDQCSITPPGSTTPTRTEDEDEGYNSGEDVDMATPASRRSSVTTIRSRMESRRGSELRTGGACVTKSIRLRKDRNHRRIRTSEQ
jgi:hypothetical protein